jgi:alanine-synthesizing transaminase
VENKFYKSDKLANVLYDIRGPVLSEAKRLEEEGFKVLKLNIGNTAPFGFDAPDELFHDVIVNLRDAQGYCDSKGLFSARKAVMQNYQQKGVLDVDIENIYIGNGVSELISIAMQALLNIGDEMLIPAPDYPLWTASTTLAGGKPVHYRCDEQSDWIPDLDDITSKITDKTKGIVVINPNNPTGSVYPTEVLEGIHRIAAENGLILFGDEIYEKIVYDGASHTSLASIAQDVFCVTFNGLSKAYRAPGFRAGWMVLSGRTALAADYQQGLELLSNMRLCSNVPAQLAIQAALGGYQSIEDLVGKEGRLREQRDFAWQRLSQIPGVSCTKPKGALYLFPKLEPEQFNIQDDQQFVLDLLKETRVLVVHGSGFNAGDRNHFRLVFLPDQDVLEEALDGMAEFLSWYRQ